MQGTSWRQNMNVKCYQPFNDFRIFSRLRSDVDRNCIGWFRRVRFYLFEMLRRASRECQNSERNNQNFLGWIRSVRNRAIQIAVRVHLLMFVFFRESSEVVSRKLPNYYFKSTFSINSSVESRTSAMKVIKAFGDVRRFPWKFGNQNCVAAVFNSFRFTEIIRFCHF